MTDTKASVACDRCGRPLTRAWKLAARPGAHAPAVYIGTYGYDCRRKAASEVARSGYEPIDHETGRPIRASS